MDKALTESERVAVSAIIGGMYRCPGYKKGFEIEWALALADYAVIFREENGIQAMADYVRWCEAHGELGGMLVTIAHDVNGRHEEFMLPRTLSYLEKKNE